MRACCALRSRNGGSARACGHRRVTCHQATHGRRRQPSALWSNSGTRRPSRVSASRAWPPRQAAAISSIARPTIAGIGGARRGHQQAGIAGRHRRFLAVEQFLVQLFARAQAGEADFHVLVRLQPGQPDHLPRQIDDLHRLAPCRARRCRPARARRQLGAADAQHAGLQHQPDRLAHRHEVAPHVGMRDGQRAAARELALEQRHHGAGAAQHVAEPHGDAAHALARRRARAAISSAWQYISASRFDAPITLVGFTALSVEISTIACAPDRARRVGDVAGAGGVGQQALQRVRLDHRHVLQRGGVEHQFGAAAPRTPRGCAPRRGCRRSARGGGTCGWVSASSRSICHSAYSPLSSRISVLRPERGDLAGELAADGAAGAGDDDAAALDQPRHAVAVERHLRRGSAGPRSRPGAVRAGAAARRPARTERGRARRAAHRQAEAVGLRRPAAQAPAPARSGVAMTSVPGSRSSAARRSSTRRHVVERAQDRLALDAPAGLARSRWRAGRRRGKPGGGPGPGRAGTGRASSPRADQQQRERRRVPPARRAGGGAGAGDTARAGCRAGRAASARAPPGRPGWAGRCRSAPAAAANSAAPSAAAPATASRSRQAGEAPVLQRQAERQRRPAAARRRRAGMVQSGVNGSAAGAAIQRASGTDAAARPPSRATLTAIRSRDRAAMGGV